MDFHNKEILKRYAKMAMGRPFAPILLNVLITSVCDMRCVHCFFTEELDDKERKKLRGFFMGLVMKELKGKADGRSIQETVKRLLGN